jgi:CRP/FNR family cyclic AMP-dependent transcriptional regulator
MTACIERRESAGELALVVEGGARSATVAALEEAETFAIYQREVAQLRRNHPNVDRVLMRFLVSEVRMLNERLLEALYVPVERRVLRRLVELARLYPGKDGRQLIALTQEVLAELAGTTGATLNQVLREEEKRGTLELQRGKTLILDMDALARRAR